MKLSDYQTLKSISQKHCINYHTLRRRALRLRVRMKRVGWTLMIANRDAIKLIRGQ